MTIYDRPAPAWRTPSPAVCLMLVLGLAVGLMFLPSRAVASFKQVVQGSLRPGLAVCSSLRGQVQRMLGLAGNLGTGATHAAELERQIEELRLHNGQLEAELLWLRSQPAHDERTFEGISPTSPLLRPRLVEARVLGRQAQTILQRHGLLDAGAAAGVSSGDLVLDAPRPLLDQGARGGTATGQLVISGGRVWGKVSQAHMSTSVVRRATDAGYRDVVRIAQAGEEPGKPGPRGILEGTGEPLCRLRMVDVTQAVSAGQLVITDGGEGLTEGQFLYGHIERVEQPAGATHWDIWVRPAISQDLPQRVAVLTGQIEQR